MRFLVFDGELINVGSIQEINFDEPAFDGISPGSNSSGSIPVEFVASDGNSSGSSVPTHGRAPARKPLAGPHHDPAVATLPRDRARILVLGRSEPLDTCDPQRIARLRELWRAKRAVGA